ncbi:MAG: hypothetical protein ABEJ66_02620, partial [Candidatus Nanohaloarchaea archaeon]
VIDVIAPEEELLEYRLVVRDEGFLLKYVPLGEEVDGALERIRARLKDELQVSPLETREVDEIPGPGGKLQPLKNNRKDG